MILVINDKTQVVREYTDPHQAALSLWGMNLKDYTVHVKGIGFIDLSSARSDPKVVEEIITTAVKESVDKEDLYRLCFTLWTASTLKPSAIQP